MKELKVTQGKDWSFSARSSDKGFLAISSKLAKNFIKCQREYIECFTDDGGTYDVGYFYNERANIGFLAAAAWREKGWVALEEFRSDKKHRLEKGKLSKGRGDLYVGLRTSKNQIATMSIEAKQCWVGTGKQLLSSLNPKSKSSPLSKAIDDVKYVTNDADYSVAAVFVTVSLKANEKYNHNNDAISDLFYEECCEKLTKPWVASAYFPQDLNYKWGKGKNRYPAVGLILVRTRAG